MMGSRSISKTGRTRLRAALLAAATAVALIATSSSARADVITFTLSYSNINNYSTGTFGTITLTDGTGPTTSGGNGVASGTVQVQEKLAPNVFANTGAAYSLEFTLNGSPSITKTNITNLEFTGSGANTATQYNLYTGNNVSLPNSGSIDAFGVAIDCVVDKKSSTACRNGTSPPQYNELTFDITASGGLKANDFTYNSLKNSMYFLSDIGIVNSSGTVVGTGYAWTTKRNNPVGPPSLPEPGSLALLGTGLIGLGFAVRRRRRRS